MSSSTPPFLNPDRLLLGEAALLLDPAIPWRLLGSKPLNDLLSRGMVGSIWSCT